MKAGVLCLPHGMCFHLLNTYTMASNAQLKPDMKTLLFLDEVFFLGAFITDTKSFT